MSLNTLSRWLPFLNWPRPEPALLKGEFWAGMTVGLMLVPQGVAYAALAGMPLVTGIYASLRAGLVAVLFSASTRLGVGPTALTSLLIGASLTGLAEPGSAQWVADGGVDGAAVRTALQLRDGAGALWLVAQSGDVTGAQRLYPGSGAADSGFSARGTHGAAVELGGVVATPSWGFLIWLRWPLAWVAWGRC
jgi:hypothetical protein